MNSLKLPFIGFVYYLFLPILSGCTNYFPKEELKGYTTKVSVNPGVISGYNTEFSVYHKGGQEISSCLQKIDVLTSYRIKLTIYAPCLYLEQFGDIWLSNDVFNHSLKSLVEKGVMQIPSIFSSFGISNNLNYNIQIVLTPKKHTYYFKKSFWQEGDAKAFIGLAIDLDEQNNLQLVNTVLNTIVHELTHVFDMIKNGSSDRFELEKIAYLAGYCGSLILGNYRERYLESSRVFADHNVFKQLIEESISDDEIKNIIKLDKVDDEIDKWHKPSESLLAIFIVQKNIYEIIEYFDETPLNNLELKQILSYCQVKLNRHFSLKGKSIP